MSARSPMSHRLLSSSRQQSSLAALPSTDYPDSAASEPVSSKFPPLDPESAQSVGLPSPPPERALRSAKLAALHARLSLPEKLPLQTLARALVDATADENPRFNNANLATLGQSLINYHISEWLMCRYPRLPMAIMYAAMSAYGSNQALHHVARQWGVESAAVPGGEVDPGLLQFSTRRPGAAAAAAANAGFGYQRTEAAYLEKFKWRRGINSRVVLDDDFGELVPTTTSSSSSSAGSQQAQAQEQGQQPQQPQQQEQEQRRQEEETTQDKAAAAPPPLEPYGTVTTRQIAERAHAQFVRAVVGALYAHAGRSAATSFVRAHVLSRQLDVSSLFAFRYPTRELARLCAREGFEDPVARLLSETGRLSRTPVFVVGIYSGRDKLGEGSAANLDAARWKAAMNALKAWYLYSPGETVRVPSDMLLEDAAPWEPVHIDIGEVI